MFIRRLIHLNHEKVKAIMKEIKASSDAESDDIDLYQTMDKEKIA